MRFVVPQGEQQGALEQKAFGVGGLAEAIQQTLQREQHQYLIEVRVSGFGDRKQTRPDRCGEIFCHASASR